jgi:hypothetical protein
MHTLQVASKPRRNPLTPIRSPDSHAIAVLRIVRFSIEQTKALLLCSPFAALVNSAASIDRHCSIAAKYRETPADFLAGAWNDLP